MFIPHFKAQPCVSYYMTWLTAASYGYLIQTSIAEWIKWMCVYLFCHLIQSINFPYSVTHQVLGIFHHKLIQTGTLPEPSIYPCKWVFSKCFSMIVRLSEVTCSEGGRTLGMSGRSFHWPFLWVSCWLPQQHKSGFWPPQQIVGISLGFQEKVVTTASLPNSCW